MDLNIRGKRALITGASRGLGNSVARLLAQEGALISAAARNHSELNRLIDELGGKDAGHFAIPLDLNCENAVNNLYNELLQRFGPPDIIVHNLGGTLGIRDSLGAVDDFRKVWQFNLGVAVELNHYFIPYMKQNSWGRVVHVSSSSAVMADASLAYSSAKAAVNTYVKGLGREMARFGVIVSAVMPGPFLTDGGHWENIAINNPERYQKFINERMAVKRLGNANEIANIISVLCSEHASFMPGSIVSVDGGIY